MKMYLESARNLVINIPEPVCIHAFGHKNISNFDASNILSSNKFLSRLIWTENKIGPLQSTWSMPVTDIITSGDEKVI